MPGLLIVELVSKSGLSLGDWTRDRFENFPSSGEINLTVTDAGGPIAQVGEAYKDQALSIDEIDGLSVDVATGALTFASLIPSDWFD